MSSTFRVIESKSNGYVIIDSTNAVVSENFANKVEALTECAKLLNGSKQETPMVKKEKKAAAEAKQAQVVQEQADKSAQATQAAIDFPKTAVGMFKADDGCWMVTSIPYNPTTGQIGKISSERAGQNKLEGEERFRITVSREVFRK